MAAREAPTEVVATAEGAKAAAALVGVAMAEVWVAAATAAAARGAAARGAAARGAPMEAAAPRVALVVRPGGQYSALIPLLQRQVLCVEPLLSTQSTRR